MFATLFYVINFARAYLFSKEKFIFVHHVCFSKINNTINNKREQTRDDDGNIKKSVKRRRTPFSAKRAENDHEPVEESYKDRERLSERNRDQYKSNEDNYRAERRKSTSSQEDESKIEKQKSEANINDNIDCDRIESRNFDNDDNDRKSEKGSVEHDANDRATRGMEH